MRQERVKEIEKRIIQFHQWLSERILGDYKLLTAEFWCSKEHVPFSYRLNSEFKEIDEGESWGESWDSAWFRLTGEIPSEWTGKKVVAQLDFNGEGLIFSSEGTPLRSVSNGSVFQGGYSRDLFPLFDTCQGGEKVDLWVEAAANRINGLIYDHDPDLKDPKRYGHYEGIVNRVRLCVFHRERWDFWLDFEVLMNLALALPENSVRRAKLIWALNHALDVLDDTLEDLSEPSSILAKELSKPAGDADLRVTAVGHAHIDTGWLWPVRESVRKCGRTFANQIAMLEEYPDYVFGASQAQHYAFVKERYPELYPKIKEFVKSGRWEIQGGMWVEADCNIISGESIVRQILHGKNFFRDEFGVETDNLWLPDVFGYSAALPQILKKSGIEYFLTSKINWSQFNKFPFSSFVWRGIDGSEVISHFPPEIRYCATLDPALLLTGRDNFREKAFLDEFISLFGVGDGGGGPKDIYIERGKREANLEGCPKVTFGRADEFFHRLAERREDLPLWDGELYLELHRGTLTTQALVKKMNRKLELKLRELEILFSCLPLGNYPGEKLEKLWKKLMINQFHDILPGSSITMVYDQTKREHREIMAESKELSECAAAGLLTEDKEAVTFFNSLSVPFQGTVVLPKEWADFAVATENGKMLPSQIENSIRVASVNIPPLSFVTLFKRKLLGKPDKSSRDPLILENDLVRYEFSPNGELLRAYDRESDREIIPCGAKGNVLTLYEDRPNKWDAWDVDYHYQNKALETAIGTDFESLADGPARIGTAFRMTIGRSSISQRVYLAANTKRLDFQTCVDWCEKHRMLRVAFPVDIANGRACFDIQYAYTERPRHRNTSWDMAKFEVAGHQYADFANPDYGAALLNDCKYGYKIYENILDLNLLRSTNYPDPDADLGEHEFTYAFLPHQGDLPRSNVMEEAARLNQAPALFPGYRGDSAQVPIALEGTGLSLEVLKKAEKEDCLVIRVVEKHGQTSFGKLKTTKPVHLIECDLMEWNDFEEHSGSEFALKLAPFEIKTFKMKGDL